MPGFETRGYVSKGFGNTLAGFTSHAGIPTLVESLDTAHTVLTPKGLPFSLKKWNNVNDPRFRAVCAL